MNADFALKKFKKNVNWVWSGKVFPRYERLFNGSFKIESIAYINSLVDHSYKGYWIQDLNELPYLLWFAFKFLQRILGFFFRDEFYLNVLPFNKMNLIVETESSFLLKTNQYLSKLFNSLNIDKDYLFLDQFITANDILRQLRYYPDTKIFLVDRDPRDIYILAKYKWRDGIIPYESVVDFCNWFIATRRNKLENSNLREVNFLMFEELIYNYDVKIKEIYKWVGLEPPHNSELIFFDPKKSRKNTRLWDKHQNEYENILIITRTLKDHLFDYSVVNSEELF